MLSNGFEEILKTFFVPKLETCQKSLNEYLDMKKKIFPRFYFISNVALLEILSNGNMPRRIMQQISGCFINLKTLKFVDKAGKLIAGMESNDREYVPFPKDLELQGQVEYWLNDVKTAVYEMHSPKWKEQVANSKFKTWEYYASKGKGYIGLQDHGHRVWFRNLKVKEL